MKLPKHIKNKIQGKAVLDEGMNKAREHDVKMDAMRFTVEKDGVTLVCKGSGEPVSVSIPSNMKKKAMDIAILDAMTEAYWTVVEARDTAAKELFPL